MYPGRILSFDKLPIRTHGTLPRPSYWSGERYFCRKCTILQYSSSCGIAHCLHTADKSGFIHLHKKKSVFSYCFCFSLDA